MLKVYRFIFVIILSLFCDYLYSEEIFLNKIMYEGYKNVDLVIISGDSLEARASQLCLAAKKNYSKYFEESCFYDAFINGRDKCEFAIAALDCVDNVSCLGCLIVKCDGTGTHFSVQKFCKNVYLYQVMLLSLLVYSGNSSIKISTVDFKKHGFRLTIGIDYKQITLDLFAKISAINNKCREFIGGVQLLNRDDFMEMAIEAAAIKNDASFLLSNIKEEFIQLFDLCGYIELIKKNLTDYENIYQPKVIGTFKLLALKLQLSRKEADEKDYRQEYKNFRAAAVRTQITWSEATCLGLKADESLKYAEKLHAETELLRSEISQLSSQTLYY